MSVRTTGRSPDGGSREAALRRDATLRDQLALLTELREVDHWRRLVAARLDLAVAAVAGIDEPVVRSLPAAPAPPFGLRALVGLASPGTACGEVAVVDQLRAVQRDLDAYARALRATARIVTADVVSRLDDHRPLEHPADHPADHPLDHPLDHPTGHPADHPAGHPADHPAGHPAAHRPGPAAPVPLVPAQRRAPDDDRPAPAALAPVLPMAAHRRAPAPDDVA